MPKQRQYIISTADKRHGFSHKVHSSYSFYLAIVLGCADWFSVDLVWNRKDCFLTSRYQIMVHQEIIFENSS